MFPSLDIFKIDSAGSVIWRGAVESVKAAKARIRKLALTSPGEYLILNQITGTRVHLMPSTQAGSVVDVRITAGRQAV